MKHIPTRSCVACRDAKPKRELVRVVRTGPDLVEVDPTGRKNGRGAYLCPAQDCWLLAQNKKALNHALEVAVTPEIWKQLWEYAAGLPEHKVLKRAEREALEGARAVAGKGAEWESQNAPEKAVALAAGTREGRARPS